MPIATAPMKSGKIYFKWDPEKGHKREVQGQMVHVGMPVIVKRVKDDDHLVYEMSKSEFEHAYGKIKSRAHEKRVAKRKSHNG